MTTPIDPIRERVKLHKGDLPALAKEAGISYSWLQKYANGKLPCSKIATAQALVAAMNARDSKAVAYHGETSPA